MSLTLILKPSFLSWPLPLPWFWSSPYSLADHVPYPDSEPALIPQLTLTLTLIPIQPLFLSWHSPCYKSRSYTFLTWPWFWSRPCSSTDPDTDSDSCKMTLILTLIFDPKSDHSPDRMTLNLPIKKIRASLSYWARFCSLFKICHITFILVFNPSLHLIWLIWVYFILIGTAFLCMTL